MTGLRLMTTEDLDRVLEIQLAAYDSFFHEKREVFADKLRFFPGGCQVWVNEDGEMVGYLFSHPWYLDNPPALDAVFADSSAPPDCYYIHDVAVHPSARKQGIATRLTEKAIALAGELGLSTMALIAVQGSSGYWGRCGFSVEREAPSYGEGASFMVRKRKEAAR